MAIEDAMQKQNIDILPDLYSDFAQFIYVVRTQYFDASIKYAMLCQFQFHYIAFVQRHSGQKP
jgi:hypothetical protein